MLNQSSSNAWTLVAYYIEPIRHFFDDPAVTSIAVLRYDAIKIRRNGRWETTDAKFDSEQTLVTAIKQIINSLGQQIDEKSAPIADARLEDGSRVNAVLYPTAHMGSNMTIRIFPKVRYSLDDLVDKGAVTKEIVDFLQLATLCRYNCLISGATGSGKFDP
jgi:pilus assembly protein CpaF